MSKATDRLLPWFIKPTGESVSYRLTARQIAPGAAGQFRGDITWTFTIGGETWVVHSGGQTY